MVVRSSIEWLCMEDCHSVKLSRLIVGFDCAGIERLSVPQPNSCLLPSYWPSPDLHIVFLQRSLRLVVGRHTQLP